MLKKLELTGCAFLAIDRAYIDYEFFEQLIGHGMFYVINEEEPTFRTLAELFQG